MSHTQPPPGRGTVPVPALLARAAAFDSFRAAAESIAADFAHEEQELTTAVGHLPGGGIDAAHLWFVADWLHAAGVALRRHDLSGELSRVTVPDPPAVGPPPVPRASADAS